MDTITKRREKLELMNYSREIIDVILLEKLILSIGCDIKGSSSIGTDRKFSEEKFQMECILREMKHNKFDTIDGKQKHYRTYILPKVIELVIEAQRKDPIANN